MTPDPISTFWEWFSGHSSELAAADIPVSLIADLEERLFAIRQLDWEIGPGQEAASLFALSPSGEPDLLPLTQHIIAQAPKVTGWEFHPAKPRRDWKLVFDLVRDEEVVEIDAKQWEFVVYELTNGARDLVFKPDSSRGLSVDDLNWAAIIIADGELGEEARMRLVQNIEIVMSWPEETAKLARRLEVGFLAKVLSR